RSRRKELSIARSRIQTASQWRATMRHFYRSTLAVTTALLVAGAGAVHGQDAARTVEGGGISVAGWSGRIDASEASQGQVLNNSRLASEGSDLRVTTGPAVAYWNPANTASG